MLKDRILSTLKFFDLQDYPLTLLEINKYLIADSGNISLYLDAQGELLPGDTAGLLKPDFIPIEEVLNCLEHDCNGEVENLNGFYFLKGRAEIANLRLSNYFYGITRERLIRNYTKFLKYIPFVRGVGLLGSQAMGQQKDSSDIDLLIITAPKFLWLARTLITGYFQIIGKRRYGNNIANRFCLNHYLVNPIKIQQLKNFYTAAEYLKLRPLIGKAVMWSFQKENFDWINVFYPNAVLAKQPLKASPKVQGQMEKMFMGKFGLWLEQSLKNWQLPKIRQEKFIFVAEDELSFHPNSKQKNLLEEFLKYR